MKIFPRLFGRDGAEAKAATVAVSALPNRTPIYPSAAFFPLANATYKKNELIYRGMNLIIGGFLQAPLRVYDSEGNEIENHPLTQLLRRPNPAMSAAQLWRKTILHLYLAGNAYWLKVRQGMGAVTELWPLRPDRVEIASHEFELIGGYNYSIKGEKKPLAVKDVVRFHFADPLDDFAGFPPLLSALVRVAIDNEAADMVKSLLQNYAVPPIAVTSSGVSIDQPMVDRLTEMWRRAFGGKNRGMPAFLQSGMDVKILGMNMRDLTLPEIDSASQKRVLVALGVPPVLLGQEATFANYEQARQSMYEDTVIPLQAEIDDVIEASLLDEFGGEELEVRFDVSEVPALRPARQARAAIALEAFVAGAATQNQYLAQIGFPPADDGDIYLRPLLMTPVRASAAASAVIVPSGQKSVRRKARRQPALENLRKVVLHRNAIADVYYEKLRDWAKSQLFGQAHQAMDAVMMRHKALTPDQLREVLATLATLEAEWAARAGESVMPLMVGLAGGAGDATASAELGIRFDIGNAEVLDFIRSYSYKFAEKISEDSASDVRGLILRSETEGWSIKQLAEGLQQKFEQWDGQRAETIARTETIRAANAGALESYKLAGITKKIWIADSDACAYCAGLDGMVIEIDEPFLTEGQDYQPQGAERAMTVSYGDVGWPPAHPNCRCAIGAEVE